MLVNVKSLDDSLSVFKKILWVYLPLNLLAVLFVPAAIQWEFPAWRGIAGHKNLLGQVALISLLLITFIWRKDGTRNRFKNGFLWGLAAVLLIGSKSATCLITAAVLVGLKITNSLYQQMIKPMVGGFIAWSYIVLFVVITALVLFSFPSIITESLALIGKNPELSRLDLWTSIFEETQKHPFLGTGIGGYWVMDSQRILDLFEHHVWLPNEAHLGILDIFNETGLVGVVIVISMLVRYAFAVHRLREPHCWKWIALAVIIINFTESTLFRPLLTTGAMFQFSYLCWAVQLMGEDD